MSSSDSLQPSSGAPKAFQIGSNQEFEESQPTLRSVSLMSAGPGLDSLPSLGIGPRFGKAPPIGLSKPAPVSQRSSSIAVKYIWNEESWNVRDPLEPVPLHFPLERTHRVIHGTSSEEVAKRISNCLRLLSVDAEYDSKNAKAKCTTADCCSFRIRLFAGGEGGHPVVVEVQRRNGSASSFMRVCRSILDGAEGAVISADATPAMKKCPPFMTKPIASMKCLKGVPLTFDWDTELNASLDKAMGLLRSKQKDVNVLGLEKLCHLTDPLKTRPDLALKACKAILLEDRCVDVRDEVAVVLQKDSFLPEEFDADSGSNLSHQARHMSLVLLSNTMTLTSKDGCLSDAVKSMKWFSDFLIPTLLDEIKAFETSSNNAYEAACALTCLASCCDVARRVMEEHSAVGDLRSSHAFGVVRHELLANESERALRALGYGL